MTVKTIFRTNFRIKTGSLDSQSITLKIAPAVPTVCFEKQLFSTFPSVSKTIKWYDVISYKTLFLDYIGTFYSPSDKKAT